MDKYLKSLNPLVRLFISVLLLMFSYHSYAVNTEELDIYNEHLSDSHEAGVHLKGGYLFFINDVQCTTNKKYAGTDESKLAERLFYQQLVEEVAHRTQIDSKASYNILPDKLLLDAKYQLVSNTRANVRSKLVIEKNYPECIRRQVRAVAEDSLPSGVVSEEDLWNIATQNLVAFVENKDFEQLADVFNDEKFSTLYSLFTVLNRPDDYVWTAESPIERSHSPYDVSGVLAEVQSRSGLVYSTLPLLNSRLAKHHYNQGKILFDKRQSAALIEQHITLAINLEPNNAKYWKILADLYRSIKPSEKVYPAKQYFIHSGADFNSWVQLFKAIEEQQPTESQSIKEIMQRVIRYHTLQPWEEEQIKG